MPYLKHLVGVLESLNNAAQNNTAIVERPICVIGMLLNWNTINSCFLSQRIQIRSTPGMAAMCITVLLIAFMLEGLRRAVKEYDRHLVKKHLEKRIASKRIAGPGMDISLTAIPPANGQQQQRPPPVVVGVTTAHDNNNNSGRPLFAADAVPAQQRPSVGNEAGQRLVADTSAAPQANNAQMDGPTNSADQREGTAGSNAKVKPVKYRPSFWEQFTRALLMTMTFILAYLLMLLGMYYNGFVLISIFLGVFFGIFVFTWGHLGGLGHAGHDNDMPSSMGEITMCCG